MLWTHKNNNINNIIVLDNLKPANMCIICVCCVCIITFFDELHKQPKKTFF